jgi:multiple sugar transport system substrate-binding protein
MRIFLWLLFISWLVVIGLIIRDDRQLNAANTVGLAGNRVEVVFWHGMSGPLGRVMEELVDRFNKQQDAYFIRSVCMGTYDTLQKKLLASIVAGQAPDIAQNYESLTKKFIKHRKIVCLDDLIASETEDIKADIIPVLLANNTFDGRLWSFPFNKSVPVLYYNKDLFRQAGLDPARPPATLDELAAKSRVITDHFRLPDGKPKVYGFATGKANVWMFLCRTLQFGGEMTMESQKKAHFDEKPAIQALEWLQAILKEGIAFEAMGVDHQNDFKAQRVAMIENSIVSKVWMEPGIKFDFGVAPLPGGSHQGVILSGTNINILDNGDPRRVKGAWEFVKWFTSTDVGAEWAVRTTYMPVRLSSLQSPYFLKAKEKDPNIEPPYVQLQYSSFEPRLSCWFEVRDMMADFLELATLQMGKPETYLKEMNDNINAILRHASD